MISRLLQLWKLSTAYIFNHVHILIVLVLLFVLPFLFIFSGQQFLEVGRANQEQLQKDRVSALHDSYEILVRSFPDTPSLWQQQIDVIAEKESDISLLMIQERKDNVLHTLASSNHDLIGATTTVSDWHAGAAVRPGTSMIYKVRRGSVHDWYVYRLLTTEEGREFFLSGAYSMAGIDAAFAARERAAYWSLALVYLFIVGLALWHYLLTDYRRLYEEEKKQNAMKDTFLHSVAHELRSPLTAIKGFASLQQETSDVATLQEEGQKIQTVSERMLHLVNDLLDVARLQSGKVKLKHESVPARDLVTLVFKEVGAVAKERGLSLVNEVSDEVSVMGDSERLQQVLVNLVNNSLKYTKEGSVTVTATEKRATVEIRIADTGAGIGIEDQHKLFTPFFRTASADSGAEKGTGLGMWITEQLVTEMGGTIGVESIKDVGTHVVLTLPATSP